MDGQSRAIADGVVGGPRTHLIRLGIAAVVGGLGPGGFVAAQVGEVVVLVVVEGLVELIESRRGYGLGVGSGLSLLAGPGVAASPILPLPWASKATAPRGAYDTAVEHPPTNGLNSSPLLHLQTKIAINRGTKTVLGSF